MAHFWLTYRRDAKLADFAEGARWTRGDDSERAIYASTNIS
jgi:hypothetical protein